MTRALVANFLFLFFLLSMSEAARPKKTAEGCRQFVQNFYDWYIPRVNDIKSKTPPLKLALQQKATFFDSTLLSALKDDVEAQHKVKSEIVGLEFDPFIGAQDFGNKYELSKAEIDKESCSIIVKNDDPRFMKQPKPDVKAQLEYRKGWKFTNFVYPNTDRDLVSILRDLKKDREKAK